MVNQLIHLKTREEIEKMHRAGQILADCHRHLKKMIRPGITTFELNQWVESFLKKHHATPEQKGYLGYPYAICASVNDEVCHAFPRKKPLQDGDIVTIDLVVNLDGWLADSAWTYAVGNISPEAKRLIDLTLKALYQGIHQAKEGNRIGDISHAIQSFAESHGLSVIRSFIGHGIGRRIHELPEVPHFGPPGQGMLLQEGMTITIEPILSLGKHLVIIQEDGWTAKTVDGSLTAQFEHTIAITKDKPLILTEQ